MLGDPLYLYQALRAMARAIDAENFSQRESALKEAHLLISQCSDQDREAGFAVYGAVRIHEAWRDAKDSSELCGTHVRFKESLPALFPGAVLVDGPKESQFHKPDAWIEFGGELMPVEIKRDFFGDAALEQLSRYMRVYGCKSGVAVAPLLKTHLPTSVRFFAVE